MRDEYKKNEDLRLVKHFASWLSKVGERPVTEENFEHDLLDGVCLCKLMSKIHGSGIKSYHQIPSSSVEALDVFKAKENVVEFQAASKRLHLPITFGTEDLEKNNITRVVSTLIFLAHVAHSQGVTVEEMGKEIIDKVEEIDEAIEQQVTGGAQLSWFQQLLTRLGLGDWISLLSVDTLKQYLTTLKKNLEIKVEERKELARQQSSSLQAQIRDKTTAWKDALPEAIKSKIPAN